MYKNKQSVREGEQAGSAPAGGADWRGSTELFLQSQRWSDHRSLSNNPATTKHINVSTYLQKIHSDVHIFSWINPLRKNMDTNKLTLTHRHTHSYPLSLAQPLESAIYTSLSSIFQLSHGLVVYTEFGKWGQPGERISEAVTVCPWWCVLLDRHAVGGREKQNGRVSEREQSASQSLMVPFQSRLSACTGWAEHSPCREGRKEKRKRFLFKWNHIGYFRSLDTPGTSWTSANLLLLFWFSHFLLCFAYLAQVQFVICHTTFQIKDLP